MTFTDSHRSKALLFDHLVGNGEHAGQNSAAERLTGLRLMTNSNFGRRLHRQIGQVRLLNAFALD